jgi:hypothetical protein
MTFKGKVIDGDINDGFENDVKHLSCQDSSNRRQESQTNASPCVSLVVEGCVQTQDCELSCAATVTLPR